VMYHDQNSVKLNFVNCSVKWPLMRLTTDGSSSQSELPAFIYLQNKYCTCYTNIKLFRGACNLIKYNHPISPLPF